MNKTGDLLLAALAAIIGLATLSVILSSKAQTSNVIKSAATALTQILGVVVSPITGQSASGSGSSSEFDPSNWLGG